MNIYSLITSCSQDKIICIHPNASSQNAAEMLRESDIGALLVTDADDKVAGILSERDLVRAYAEHGAAVSGCTVGELMTTNVVTCDLEEDVMDVMAVLHERHIRHIPVIDNGSPVAMLSLRDFEHACNELQHLALTDPLTGLSNRRAFFDNLDREIGRHRRFNGDLSLAVLDIDHFKAINDTFGHDAGDQVLCCFARILLAEFRVFDTIGRIGGEEFALLFPQTTLHEATLACDRILDAIKETIIPTDAGEIMVTFSAGLTELKASDTSGRELLKRADAFLYNAKKNGRSRLSIDRATAPKSTSALDVAGSTTPPH